MSEQDFLKSMRRKKISRRGFLGGAAALTAGGILAGRLPGVASASPIQRPSRNPYSLPRVLGAREEPKGRLLYLSSEPFAGTWDPTAHMILANLHAEWNTFDRLFELDPMTGEFVPALGLSYKIIPEGLEFTLRRGVKFHSGDEFTSADVKYTLERYTKDTVTADYFPEPVTVEIIDDYSCKAITNTPLPVLNLLGIVHIHSHQDSPETLSDTMNGTGPFKFVSYAGETATWEAFPDYWKGPARLKEFVMEYVGDPSTRLAALQKGEAQAIDRVPSDHVSTIAGDPALLMVTGQSTEYTYLLWKETSSEFTANKLVRQAVAHCIDNEGIVEGLMGGHAGVPDSIYSDAVWPFGAPAGASLPTYDLAAAAQKLEEAGYPNGEGLPEFNVVGVVGFYPNMKEYMEYITAQCAQVGIKMRLEIKEAAAWQDAYFGPEPTCDAAFIGWMNMSAEPDEFFLPFYRSGNTITHMNDPEIDALLTKDNTCKVLEDRAKIVREEIVPKLADLAITPPIVQTLNMNATLSQVKNYALLPNSCFVLWDTYIEETTT